MARSSHRPSNVSLSYNASDNLDRNGEESFVFAIQDRSKNTDEFYKYDPETVMIQKEEAASARQQRQLEWETAQEKCELIRSHLNPNQLIVFDLVLKGYTLSEIVGLKIMPRSNVYYNWTRIREIAWKVLRFTK